MTLRIQHIYILAVTHHAFASHRLQANMNSNRLDIVEVLLWIFDDPNNSMETDDNSRHSLAWKPNIYITKKKRGRWPINHNQSGKKLMANNRALFCIWEISAIQMKPLKWNLEKFSRTNLQCSLWAPPQKV